MRISRLESNHINDIEQSHFLFEMDPSFFEQAALELEADAKDFQRAVDTQLSIFVREKELHERTIQELNRSLLPVEITTRKDKRA